MQIPRYGTLLILLSVPLAARSIQQNTAPHAFTVDQILGFPSPENLVASPVGSTIAWTFNERGVRNVYVADGPGFEPRRLTPYREDDGQELTQLSFSSDGTAIVYVRGGDHGSNRQAEAPPNPAGSAVQPRIQIWSIRAAGGAPRFIGDGDDPAVAPGGDRVAFVRNRQIWFAPLDGSEEPKQAFYARGTSESPAWSPDGRTLAFVSNRNDHSFIGLFTAGQPIRFIAPSTSRDSLPAWSPDGTRIAFLRQPGAGGAPRPPLARPEPPPWSILVANVEAASRDSPGDLPVVTAVASGQTPVDPILQNPGGIGFRWAADDSLVYLSYRDGFPHLYSIQHPGTNSKPTLLTPGSFMVEQFTLTPDRRFVIYNANTGPEPGDIARRHLFKVPVNAATPTPLAGTATLTSSSSGTGIEWSPVVTADNQMVAFLRSDAQRPPAPAVVPVSGGTVRPIGPDLLPADFPGSRLVTPTLVSFRASDGVEVHGQLFEPGGGGARKPAIVYIHGGGPRQMLLGWHYRWEYANDYGANQYLASRGFIVLSVDYRLSVGYGQAFQFPDHTGARGAAEYRDVLAAGRYLQARPDVDPKRIGVWGASLGGYLTALALGRNSDVFAAGVDVHGVHDRLPAINALQQARAIAGDGITEADVRQALKVAFESSPIAAVPTWRSPVLLIHGDDDRVVDFHQTVDLERRLLAKGVKVESLVLPDDVHDSLLWRNWRTAISAMSEFFERTLQNKQLRN
jgi:dipeptidyl aminopeptidase/acylaminoacyl peptidase